MAVYTSFNPRLGRKSIYTAFNPRLNATGTFGAPSTAPAPAPTPGAGAASTTPQPQFNPDSLPLDPTYDAQTLGLQNTRDNDLARLNQQRAYQLGNAGYSATYDDQGRATGLSFDPNNPYSQAALARQHYQNSKRGIQNSAGNQIFSGSTINRQNAADQNFAVDEDRRQKALLNFLSNNLSSQTGVKNAYETGVGQAKGDRLSRALQNFLAQNGG